MSKNPTEPTRVAWLLMAKTNAVSKNVYFTDKMITITCSACNKHQNLQEAIVLQDEEATLYECHSCKALLVAVTPFPSLEWTGGGSRLRDFIIHHKKDFYVTVPDNVPIKFPGKASAFDRKSD